MDEWLVITEVRHQMELSTLPLLPSMLSRAPTGSYGCGVVKQWTDPAPKAMFSTRSLLAQR